MMSSSEPWLTIGRTFDECLALLVDPTREVYVAAEGGAYRIAGRLSTDIIKSGGYKISALEIENVLAAHPAIAECCVVGLPDDTWGERVAAAVVLRPGTSLELDGLRDWARGVLAPYKCPTVLRVVGALPRNVMGKVVKPAAKALF